MHLARLFPPGIDAGPVVALVGLGILSGCHPDAGARHVAPLARPLPLGDGCDSDSKVDVVDHQVTITVALAPPSLSGSGDVRVRARTATRVAILDAERLNVTAASVDGVPAPFVVRAGHVCVEVPPLAAEAEQTLHLAWSAATDGATPHFSATDVWAGYSTSSWMPTLLDSRQRATLSLTVLAPDDLAVVATGRPVDGAGTGRAFVVDHPVAPFVFAFAAGRFVETDLDADGVTLRALAPAGVNVGPALAVTATSLAFLRAHTGAPFPARSYTQVFVHGDAAQEAAGFAILSAEAASDLANDPHEDWVFTHELAHQWFGWLVPCADFADFWLNEGFATFLVAAAKEARWGEGAYDHELGLWLERSERAHAAGREAPVALSRPDGSVPADFRDTMLQARGVTYSRGALVLARLRAELGDPVFWDGIRRYVSARAGRGARTRDLELALEDVSGRDLRPFFAKWVYAPARPSAVPRRDSVR